MGKDGKGEEGEEEMEREGISMLSSKHQHLEQLTMHCHKSFLFYTHKVDNSSKFKAHLLPPRKAMLTPLGTAWATTCAPLRKPFMKPYTDTRLKLRLSDQ